MPAKYIDLFHTSVDIFQVIFTLNICLIFQYENTLVKCLILNCLSNLHKKMPVSKLFPTSAP